MAIHEFVARDGLTPSARAHQREQAETLERLCNSIVRLSATRADCQRVGNYRGYRHEMRSMPIAGLVAGISMIQAEPDSPVTVMIAVSTAFDFFVPLLTAQAEIPPEEDATGAALRNLKVSHFTPGAWVEKVLLAAQAMEE